MKRYKQQVDVVKEGDGEEEKERMGRNEGRTEGKRERAQSKHQKNEIKGK